MVNSTMRIFFFITKSEGVITLQRAPISALSFPNGSKLHICVEYTTKCFFFALHSCESLHLPPHGRSSNCECRWCSWLSLCACVLVKAGSRDIVILTFDSAHWYSLWSYHPSTVHTVWAHDSVIYLYNIGLHVWGTCGPAAQWDDTTWVMASLPTWVYICLHSE